jgi:hypothetical protein
MTQLAKLIRWMPLVPSPRIALKAHHDGARSARRSSHPLKGEEHLDLRRATSVFAANRLNGSNCCTGTRRTGPAGSLPVHPCLRTFPAVDDPSAGTGALWMGCPSYEHGRGALICRTEGPFRRPRHSAASSSADGAGVRLCDSGAARDRRLGSFPMGQPLRRRPRIRPSVDAGSHRM